MPLSDHVTDQAVDFAEQHLWEEVATVQHAPIFFVIAVGICALAIYFWVRSRFHDKLESKDSIIASRNGIIDLRDAEIRSLRNQTSDAESLVREFAEKFREEIAEKASPDALKERIGTLERPTRRSFLSLCLRRRWYSNRGMIEEV